MKIYLLQDDNKTFIDEAKTFKKCLKIVSNKIEEYKVISYYYRYSMIDDNSVMIDFGSWSDFFIIEGVTLEDILST